MGEEPLGEAAPIELVELQPRPRLPPAGVAAGQLVNDDKAYNDVVSTLDSIKGGVDTLSGTLGAINKFKIDLDPQDEVEETSLLHLLLVPNLRGRYRQKGSCSGCILRSS